MQNHYSTLGVNSSATNEEIRRAYRILARRYHPDVNPGKASEEIFKKISEAYAILSDPEKRRLYDIDSDSPATKRSAGAAAERAFRRAASAAMHEAARRRFEGKRSTGDPKNVPPRQKSKESDSTSRSQPRSFGGVLSGIKTLLSRPLSFSSRDKAKKRVNRVSVVEISLSIKDAILGAKKTIELAEGEESRKISIKIPPGTRSGSIIHLRSLKGEGEEVFIVARVATHHFITISQKGLIVEIPITVGEAINGASISVPTLEEPISIRVPPGSQSGDEVRVKEKGISLRDSSRGDLFYRLLVRVPESTGAVGLKEKGLEMEAYYGASVRQSLPPTLI